jgi:Ankyrin repeats (3 copies)
LLCNQLCIGRSHRDSLGKPLFPIKLTNHVSIMNSTIMSSINEQLCQASAQFNQYRQVQQLIPNGADVMYRNNESLMNAACWGRAETVLILIANGADVTARKNKVIHWTSRNGHADIVQILINNGADVESNKGEAIKLASDEGHIDVVQVLLQHSPLLARYMRPTYSPSVISAYLMNDDQDILCTMLTDGTFTDQEINHIRSCFVYRKSAAYNH